VNSEELELSLRTEFDSHLRTVVADMRQEFSQLQAKVETEFEKHKSQLDAVFQEFSGRLENTRELEAGFAETVVEHLRLSRDEGARISATAFAEAEKLQAETAAAAPPKAGISELSAAITDITAQDSQATILKSLVQHAAQFTPRGAFSIIKNEHFVGWRVFGKEGDLDEQSVREVFFPVAAATALGESVRSLSAVETSYGNYSDDSIYLNKLEFGQPERMYAVPLIARGRGVAVLYADYGTQGEEVNIEALETLVRVAGLTVEVLAAAPIAKPTQEFQAVSSDVSTSAAAESREEYREVYSEPSESFQSVPTERLEESRLPVSDSYSALPVSEYNSVPETVETEPTSTDFAQYEETAEEMARETVEETVEENNTWRQPSAAEDDLPTYQTPVAGNDFSIPQPNSFQFDEPATVEYTTPEPVEAARFEAPLYEPAEKFPVEPSYLNGQAETPVIETFEPVASEVVPAAPPIKSRFTDRNVDLPIEVGEDERRLHNDARRFARLLVSEIKLYNEQKVKEGREAQDLYERLREAIDRSRDMYDTRVQPPVAAKFDYFHYELVSSLAEGEENRLGGNYPGAVI